MRAVELQKQLAEAQATIRALQDELAATNRGLVALTMELEQRVDERKRIEVGLEKTRKELAVIKQSADEAREYAESIINTVRNCLAG
jgi:chromosome segregation ATPase